MISPPRHPYTNMRLFNAEMARYRKEKEMFVDPEVSPGKTDTTITLALAVAVFGLVLAFGFVLGVMFGPVL